MIYVITMVMDIVIYRIEAKMHVIYVIAMVMEVTDIVKRLRL